MENSYKLAESKIEFIQYFHANKMQSLQYYEMLIVNIVFDHLDYQLNISSHGQFNSFFALKFKKMNGHVYCLRIETHTFAVLIVVES